MLEHNSLLHLPLWTLQMQKRTKQPAEKKAKADAKARRDSMSARAEAGDEKRKADRSVAKERCEGLSGDAKDACQRQAKSK